MGWGKSGRVFGRRSPLFCVITTEAAYRREPCPLSQFAWLAAALLLPVLSAPAPNPPAPNRLAEIRQRGSRPAAPAGPLRPPDNRAPSGKFQPARPSPGLGVPPASPLRDAPVASSGAFRWSPPGARRNRRHGTARLGEPAQREGTRHLPRTRCPLPHPPPTPHPGTPLPGRPLPRVRAWRQMRRGSVPAAAAGRDALRLRQTALAGEGPAAAPGEGAPGRGRRCRAGTGRAVERGAGSGGRGAAAAAARPQERF